MKPFSIGEIIKLSYEAFKQYWGVLLGLFAVVVAVQIGFSIVGEMVPEEAWVSVVLFTLVSMIVGTIIQLGQLRITLTVADGGDASLNQLFSETALLWRYIGATILYSLMVMVGFLLLVIPGIYIALRYSQYTYLLVDKRLGAIESLKKSSELTKGVKWRLLGLGLVMGLLVVVSMIPLLLGLLVTVPMAMVAGAFVYRKLVVATEGARQEAVTEAAINAASSAYVPYGQA